jgi:hypothetical protein
MIDASVLINRFNGLIWRTAPSPKNVANIALVVS